MINCDGFTKREILTSNNETIAKPITAPHPMRLNVTRLLHKKQITRYSIYQKLSFFSGQQFPFTFYQ